MEERRKVLVIGLDGASWNVIKPLVKEGRLPTIEKLMQNGCYGDLESCIPAMTFPAWKCYSTGKNPGKLGVYSFRNVDVDKHEFGLYSSISFKSEELWDYLGENNITCGVLDMPTTYPCRTINGVMISHGAPRPWGYAYPRELEKELKARFNYKIDPDYLPQVNKDAAVPSTRSIIEQRFDVAKYILQEFNPSFFHLTIFHIDPIQHYYWKDMEENDPKYGKVIEDFWALIDSRIGSLLEELGDEKTYVFLMSDHGQTAVKATFHIAKWLMQRDMLPMKRHRSALYAILSGLGQNRDKVFSIVGKTRTAWLVKFFIPKHTRQEILGLFPTEQDDAGQDTLLRAIDWLKTRVIPTPHGPVYLNRAAFASEKQFEEFKNDLITELKAIENPRTGEKLAKEVYRREEIYWGKHVDQAPDIVILPNEGYEIASSAVSRQLWDYSASGWSAVHRLQGIFLAMGPEIKKGIEIQGARIYDLAPTILHIFGIPIPKDIDGKVLKEIFREDSTLAKRETEYVEVTERARVKGRIREIKGLGKI